MTKKLFLFLMMGLLFSCTSDDDICLNGDATSRLKIKFKDKDGKIKKLDSIYVNVDYGEGLKNVVRKSLTDSVIIPLRVDENPFTDVYVSTTKKGKYSKVKMNYTTKSEYVSPACGIKKIYENFNPVVETFGEVSGLEINQNQISNEAKTHIFLIF